MPDIDDRWHKIGPDGKKVRNGRYGKGSRWIVRWRDPEGIQRGKSFTRKAEAEAFATQLDHNMMSGSYIDPSAGKVLMADWAGQWLAAQAHVKPTSYYRTEGIVRTYVLPRWGQIRISDIAHADVQRWISSLAKKIAPASVAKVHRTLSLILDWAVKNDRLAKNPAQGINLPRATSPERRYLSPAQVKELAQTCEPYSVVISFLAYTGLRWGEMAALRTEHVDLDRRRVQVVQSVTEVNGRLVWGTPKTHERRTVPLPRFLADELAKHLVDKVEGDLVFTAPKGGVLRLRNFRRAVFDRAVTEVGPEGFHPHELRHTAASLAIAAGAEVKLVQQMLGHKTATLTLDLYGHLFPDRLDDIADRLDSAACEPDVYHSGS
ncbi:tyrosine-type recombinase/integrase [Bounagaea algeriensis]